MLLTNLISTEIGIKEWLAPQISEHCPVYKPNRLERKKDWFKRPGFASILTPKEGKAQEWITSAEVANRRMFWFKGKTKLVEHLIKRNLSVFSMKALKSTSDTLTYSYLQYHWCPVIFTVTMGDFLSSIK